MKPGARRISNGMFSIYLDPKHFGAQDFVAEAQSFVDYVKSSTPAQPNGEVLVPGEQEHRTRTTRLRDGIPLQADTWASITAAAASVGVQRPA